MVSKTLIGVIGVTAILLSLSQTGALEALGNSINEAVNDLSVGTMSIKQFIDSEPSKPVMIIGEGERVFWGAMGGWVYYLVDETNGYRLLLVSNAELKDRLSNVIPSSGSVTLRVTGKYYYDSVIDRDCVVVHDFVTV